MRFRLGVAACAIVQAMVVYATHASTPRSYDGRHTPESSRSLLYASDSESGLRFGTTVAVDGDTLAVGARYAGTMEQGAVYIFERMPDDSWVETAVLTASDPDPFDWLGISLALSGDTLVAGAMGDDENCEGVCDQAGAAYVFERDQGGPDSWGEVRKLLASDGASNDLFGDAVGISGDTIVVGARWSDVARFNGGQIYVFDRDEGGLDSWGEAHRLTASDSDPLGGDNFGFEVAIDGDTIVASALGVRPNGAAYLLERDPGTGLWNEAVKHLPDVGPPNPFGYQYGISVAIDGTTAVIGAEWEIVDAFEDGAAYVYERDQGGLGAWGRSAKLGASDWAEADHFGQGVAIDGDRILVGARDQDAGNPNPLFNAGATYLFERDSGGADAWNQTARFAPVPPVEAGVFGAAVAVSGSTLLASLIGDDTACPSDPACNSGAVWTADLTPLDLTITGSCPASLTVSGTGAFENSQVALVGSPAPGSTPIPAGACRGVQLEIGPPILLGILPTDSEGAFSLPLTNVPPAACGAWIQAVDLLACRPSEALQPP